MTALAGLPVAGWRLSVEWFLVIAGVSAVEQFWFAWPRLRARADEVFSWIRNAGYSVAAFYFVAFHTGAAQTFGVTLFGLILFRTLAKDYAHPRRLMVNFIPPVLAIVVVQSGAAAGLLAQHQPLLLITLLASPIAIFGLLRSVRNDLTQYRSRLAAAVTRAEASAREIQDADRIARIAETLAGVGYWSFDVASNASTVSEGVCKIFGVSPLDGPPTVEALMSLYHPDDRRRVDERLAGALAEGAPFAFEARIVLADGEVRHVVCHGATERDGAGAVATVFGALLDVTEAHLRERALSESEARFRMLADHSTDVIVWMTARGDVLYTSPSMTSLGYAPEEVVGRNALEFVHPDDRDLALAIIGGLFTGEPLDETVRRENRFLKADGQYVWLEGKPTIIRDQDGRSTSVVSSFRDVSARHRLEDDLIAARQRAEAAVEAKSEFLANMSHEIRTPLTGIIGFSGLLSEIDRMPPIAATYVRRISASGQALLSVVNDILDFSKLEAGQVELDPHPFDVVQLFEDTMAMVSTQAAAKAIGLRLTIDGEMPRALNADSARLRQILVNLLGNAIKFTDHGSVTVTATHDAARSRLRLAVSDTGCGVPADKLERLFQRFSQVDGSISRSHGGTGLGLSICKTLVELMGGQIGVVSKVGVGSTFEFWVTAPASALGPDALDPAALEPASDMPPSHILVVDDLDVNRELVRAILEATGHSVQEAASGADAVKAALQTRFDLILMDLQMPGMDGYAASKAIRSLASSNQQTPIVALSANVLPEHVDAGAAAGMNGHIGKPIVPEELLGAVARWSGQRVEDAAEEGGVQGRGGL
ncbi:MAG TPA: PAS domain S-box protein [Caulobacteraceae bacterium]